MKLRIMNDEWGAADFLSRYASYSSRYSSPECTADEEGLRFNSPPLGSLYNSSEKQFCRRENVDQCIAYLNQELSILGFQSLFSPSCNGQGPSDTFDIVKLINSTYELLQAQQQNFKTRTSLEERNLRSECDNDHLLQSQKRLKEQVDSLQRELAMCNERERQLQEKHKKIKEDLKNEKDEVKRTKANVQQLHKQYNHERRKQEKETTRLKERLHQMLTDKSQEKRIGMDVLNAVQRADGKRAMWKTGNRDENEMYRLLITNYDARQKELMKENNDLRDSLKDMQAELISVLNQQQAMPDSDSEDYQSEDCSLSVRSLPAGHFNMPYELAREGIEKSLRDKWRMLRSRLDHANKGSQLQPMEEHQSQEELEQDISKLTKQLDNYRHIVEQQEALIESLQPKEAETSATQDSSILSDSRLCEEWDRLQNERALFGEQKGAFENERKNFMDSAIKLGQERKKFEDERTVFIKQQFLVTPQRKFSSGIKKSRSPDGRASPPKLQFSTPMFSPAPRKTWDTNPVRVPRDGPVFTPTTDDLYRALSLQTGTENVINETPKQHGSLQSDGSVSSGRSSESREHHHRFKNRRINAHAQNVKRALELKQQSPSYE